VELHVLEFNEILEGVNDIPSAYGRYNLATDQSQVLDRTITA
jgi:hypothetical protein